MKFVITTDSFNHNPDNGLDSCFIRRRTVIEGAVDALDFYKQEKAKDYSGERCLHDTEIDRAPNNYYSYFYELPPHKVCGRHYPNNKYDEKDIITLFKDYNICFATGRIFIIDNNDNVIYYLKFSEISKEYQEDVEYDWEYLNKHELIMWYDVISVSTKKKFSEYLSEFDALDGVSIIKFK